MARREVILSRRADQLAAAPQALRHRPGGGARSARHRGRARPAGRRREPAGPPRILFPGRLARSRSRSIPRWACWRAALIGAALAAAPATGSAPPTISRAGGFIRSPRRHPLSRTSSTISCRSPCAMTATRMATRARLPGPCRADALEEPRLRAAALARSARAAADPLQLYEPRRRLGRDARLRAPDPRDFRAAGLRPPIAAARSSPAPRSTTDEAIDAFIRAKVESAYHPSVHLPDGRSERSDGGGRSARRGSSASRACAWSIPRSCRSITTGNLNAPTIMIGGEGGRPSSSASRRCRRSQAGWITSLQLANVATLRRRWSGRGSTRKARADAAGGPRCSVPAAEGRRREGGGHQGLGGGTGAARETVGCRSDGSSPPPPPPPPPPPSSLPRRRRDRTGRARPAGGAAARRSASARSGRGPRSARRARPPSASG